MRGDGKSGVRSGDLFEAKDYPGTYGNPPVDVVLTNPPFLSDKIDKRVSDFVDRGLAALRDGGIYASIVPDSLLNAKVRAAPGRPGSRRYDKGVA